MHVILKTLYHAPVLWKDIIETRYHLGDLTIGRFLYAVVNVTSPADVLVLGPNDAFI
jgi:hypothetical protein